MSDVTFTQVPKRYKLSVQDGYLRFITSADGTAATYDVKAHRLDVLKSVGLAVDASNKKIYASGKVYDVTNNVRGGTLTVDVIAIPGEIADQARGAVAKGAGSYDLNLPHGKEFGFGFSSKMSDGSGVYVWYPRCKLNYANETDETSDDGDIDPSESYEIECMPTEEGIWRVKYYTANVEESKTPHTMEEFVKEGLYTKAAIDGFFGSEATAGV